MTDIFKLLAIALAGGFLSVTLKDYRREYAVIVGLVTAVLVMAQTVPIIYKVIGQFTELSERAQIKSEYIAIVVKTVGIAYISEFAVQTLKDAGENAVAAKAEFAGKLLILYITFPIITELLEVCIDALNSI